MTWIIVGLGNPGEEYERTRHNAGRMAVESFARMCGADVWKEDKKAHATLTKGAVGKNLFLALLPDTFMNKSGSAVVKYVKSVKAAEKMVVVYDDLDLPLGTIKISFNRGSGGHKGLESIMRGVKTKKFTRIRVGVSRATASGKIKKPEAGEEVNDFILGRFREAELDTLRKVLKRVAEAISVCVSEGPTMAMNQFN